ncbi:MAG TPA: 1-deoxy-D-xylulose-5-phosphate reductoisomerase [Syntrophales bacterium]|nr:1-deoxy-D-xylulose-5-phosphate reductoisomerase [Syntrophales bacterium]
MKILSILGCTGSIGVSTLDVVWRNRGRFSVAALAAGRNVARLAEQIDRFRPKLACVADEEAVDRLRAILPGGIDIAVRCGVDGYREAAALSQAGMTVSALGGSAGLLPTLAAVEAGKDVALANKETLVMAGAIVMERIREKGVRLLPMDSEHSAIFQCLSGNRRADVRRLILTASGGPFRKCSSEEIAGKKAADALRHPKWNMGRKITVDSATLMNKGLEVIEAHWLFGMEWDAIDVVIHPQSIIHSLVEYHDGSVIAQLGVPDMRIPIAYALSCPERLANPIPALDLIAQGVLEFGEPDLETFPCLGLAYRAARAGGTMPAALNAANEAAVEAFLEGRIGFPDIARIVAQVLDAHVPCPAPSLSDILSTDAWGRAAAASWISDSSKGREGRHL